MDILEKAKKIHFIGVGGIGISAVARMMLEEGKIVTGSDRVSSIVTDELEKEGAKFILGQRAENIDNDIDLIIYSNAISVENPELKEARARGIKTISYPEALGVISQEKFTIAVSGTSGKTTVTAMIAKIMLDAGLDPTVVVGSMLLEQKSNFVAGKSKPARLNGRSVGYLVVEADEYKKAFHNLEPSILVINNITPDHLDYFKDLADIQSAFCSVVEKVPETGFVVCDINDPNVAPVIAGAKAGVINYPDYNKNIPKLKLPGGHNISNAAAAWAVSKALGIDESQVKKSLENFAGTWRRFEYKGKAVNDALIYDDYAHNPEKIQAALAGAREMFPGHRIFAVFQPHLYSRTKLLFDKFTESFHCADEIILAPIYAAREESDPSITSEILAAGICKKGKSAMVCNTEGDIEKDILAKTKEGDVIIFIGAGDLNKLAEKMAVK